MPRLSGVGSLERSHGLVAAQVSGHLPFDQCMDALDLRQTVTRTTLLQVMAHVSGRNRLCGRVCCIVENLTEFDQVLSLGTRES